MEYALQPGERPDGRLFEVERFTQRILELRGDHHHPDDDEVLYVLHGTAAVEVDGARHELRPGMALFVPAGTAWKAEGDARAVSVIVHDPEPSSASTVVD